MKKYKEKIKRTLCALSGHKFRIMHTKYKKRTDEYVYVYKCIRCGKIKTLKIPAVVIVCFENKYMGGQK